MTDSQRRFSNKCLAVGGEGAWRRLCPTGQQVWAKPQPPAGSWAVLFLNGAVNTSMTPLAVSLPRDLGVSGPMWVRDIWRREDLGLTNDTEFRPPTAVAVRDSAFFLLSPRATGAFGYNP